MSCAVPIGPLMPRSGYRARSSSSRAWATSISSAADANRLPSVVACAATLWLRPASTSSACSAARRASRASTATERSRMCSQRQPDLQLLDVLGEVAAGQALVHVLVPGQGVELLDARLDVVPGDPLAGGDGVEVHLVDDPLVVGDHAVRHVDAQVALGSQHGEPQPALQNDLVLGRPQSDELGARVAGGQDVGDHVG